MRGPGWDPDTLPTPPSSELTDGAPSGRKKCAPFVLQRAIETIKMRKKYNSGIEDKD